jgi:hypothetical protein
MSDDMRRDKGINVSLNHEELGMIIKALYCHGIRIPNPLVMRLKNAESRLTLKLRKESDGT